MAKDPAYLFYSDNFLSGTMFMSDEQVGKYIRLLCAQHLTGHLLEKDMIKICKSQDDDIWSKFVKDDEGKFYNIRLEAEILKRKKFSESRSKNRQGKTSDKIKPKKKKSKTYDKDMGNGNEDGNTIEYLGKGVQGENLEKSFDILEGSKIWIEKCMIRYKLSESDFMKALSEFKSKCIVACEDQSVTGLMKYFSNWYPLNKERIFKTKKTNDREANNTAIDKLAGIQSKH